MPKLLNFQLALCSLINIGFLPSCTAHFDKDIGLALFALSILDFYFLYFFYTSSNTVTLL